MNRFLFFLMTLIFVAGTAYSQETKTAKTDSADYFSEYSEYSWLWDDPKAKAKAEKKRLKEEKKKQKELAKQKKLQDTTKVKAVDSVQVKKPTAAADSVKTLPVQSDTLKSLQQMPADTIPDPK
ncbi:MAG: hypothetical protein AAFO69_14425, partial [Bacteroidota bacterium]